MKRSTICKSDSGLVWNFFRRPWSSPCQWNPVSIKPPRDIKKTLFLSLTIAANLFLASCVKDGQNEPIVSGEVPLRFIISSSGNNGDVRSASRAISIDQESEISTIDVLAFYEDTGGEFRYAYKCEETSWPSGNPTTLKVTTKGRTRSERQLFVVLANASQVLSNANILPNEEMSRALKKITCAIGDGEWPTGSGMGEFKPIPMYAKTDALIVVPETINELTQSNGNPFPMIRMVCRIDVGLKTGVNNFTLEEVRLYNRKTSGYVAYDFSGFNGNDATSAGVPAGNPTGDPILKPSAVYQVTGNKTERAIYTYESPAFAEADRMKATALVVGGRYKGQSISWYRIDLKTSDDTTDKLSSPLLRNHHYKVEIQSVSGNGASSPDDAYDTPPVIKAVISKWDLNSMAVVADGEHSLTLSRDKMITDKNGFTNAELSITTDASSGIFIEPYADKSNTATASWLTYSNSMGTDGATSRIIKLSTIGTYTGVDPRITALRIRVRNMYYYLTVKQYGQPAISASPDARYQTDGQRHTFTVASVNDTDIRWYPVLKSAGPTASNPLIIDAMDYTATTLTFRATASTKEDGSAVIAFTDPAGLWSVDIPVKVINCGVSNKPLRSYIGSYKEGYLTIMYGNKCWMLENSKENPALATANYYGESGGFVTGEDVPVNNEHYYIWGSVSNSAGCPSGWSVPSLSDVAPATTTNSAASILMSHITTTNTEIYWFGPAALCGYATNGIANNGIISPLDNLWHGWESEGRWWYNNAHACFRAENGILLMTAPKTSNIYNLRCVKVM